MKRARFSLCVLAVVPCLAALNVPLTVQETIYPGSVAGVARTSDPVTAGIPLPDDAANGVSEVSQLRLTGATVGQFRVLGRWPSGRIKWLLVDTQASLSAGQKNTSIVLTTGGSGNFGGAALAADNGSTILVDTGAARFTIRKANFNGIDQASIGSTNVLSSGASQGLVLHGPTPGQSVCPPCTTVYSSANDSESTAVIEENGPAKAVIRATGSHRDAQGNAYMRFTVRLYFFKGKTHVKLTSVLRNADYGGSNSLATAYKGHEGYELQLSPAISTGASFAIGNHTGSPTAGTLAATDKVHLYQGESQQMKWQDWCGFGCVPYTSDSGYAIVKNGAVISSGSNTQYPQGWADVRSAGGAGVEIGVYQLSAYWPKSLVLDQGGRDVRIGIWARENSQPYYQPWPQWSIHDLYLNFHAAPLASASADFLRFQHYLVARAPYSHYNDAGVFPYPLVAPADEDAFYLATQAGANPQIAASKACCIQDFGTQNIFAWPLHVFRYYAWSAPGGANQTEFRWSYLLNFLTRGFTGRYLEASHFYKFQAESFLPHSDGFDWRDHPSELDGFGQPSAASANSSKAFRNWRDQEHGHWYGMTDYYFLSGDETIREAMNDQAKDWFLNNRTYQNGALGGKAGTVSTNGTQVRLVIGSAFISNLVNGQVMINGVPYSVASVTGPNNLVLKESAGTQNNVQYFALGGLYNSRSIGVQLIGAARYAQFLAATGDGDSASVLQQGINDFAMQVKPDLCVSGYPAGCTLGPVDGGPWSTQGVSRVRGVPWGPAGTSGSWCGVSHAYRVNSGFQPSILIQGLLELRDTAGPNWADYWTALDLAHGVAQWNLSENYVDDGSGRWDTNGFRFGIALDRANTCTAAGESPEPNFQPVAMQTVAMNFLAKHAAEGNTAWAPQFKTNLLKLIAALGVTASDLGSYQLAAVIGVLSNPGSGAVNDVPVSNIVDHGGGAYTISWTVPAGAVSYRIKWGARRIVDWIGFDPATNVFLGNPAQTMPWFAANSVAGAPAPAAAGTVQSFKISTGVTGLTAANFRVKAYGGTSQAPSGGVAASLTPVSGSGQSGTAGEALSSPLVVRVVDGSGNGVPGVAVSFTVTAGGGQVLPSQAQTSAQGLASTTLTLGGNPGGNSVRATVAGLSPVTFTATATAPVSGAAASLELASGSGQSGSPGSVLPESLVVVVTDAAGNPVPGVDVQFSVTSGGGSVAPALTASDSAGRASATLTLGAAAGVNVVAATAGSLAGSPVTFTASAVSEAPTGPVSVTWSRQTANAPWPGWVGWLSMPFDPVSRQTILYATTSDYRGIYSTNVFFYDSASNKFTDVGGTGSKANACPADTATMPGDRHPGWQMAIDTKRNLLWMYGGVNVNCPDNPRQDMYYLTLNPNPSNNTWQRVTPAQIPVANGTAAMVYDPDDDVLFVFGADVGSQTHNHWVYCRTLENPTPGTPTAKQLAAGCARADDWNEIAVSAGVRPPGVVTPGLVYDTVTKKVYAYGGMDGSLTISYNEMWAYDVPTKTWTKKALSSPGPPVYNGNFVAQPALAYNTATNKLIFHQTHNSGAPADWIYDPVADTWTKLASSGGGPANDAYMAYDGKTNRLITWSQDIPNGVGEVWHGSLSTSSTEANACDLNGDGAVNVLDVQNAVRQALGTASCANADLNGDGACNNTDVQKIVTASIGGACIAKP